MSQRRLVVRVIASLGVVGAISVAYRAWLPTNPTTIALTYLVAILLIASGWGIAEATAASLFAVFSFNFFFLPPVGTLTIADPQNWVALVAFLVTSIVASQLSGRARRRTLEALARQRDLERLYSLGRALLLIPTSGSLAAEIVRHTADVFQLSTVALYDRQTGVVSKAGPLEVANIDARLEDVAVRRAVVRDSSLVIVPLRLGAEPIGSLAIAGDLDETVLQSVANLAAIGLERARSQALSARAEAAQQSGELRATVLDAVAHEFKTPLTSIRAAASDLLQSMPAGSREHELAAIVNEESSRMQGLVTDAVTMLRIESGGFHVHRATHRLRPLVSAIIEYSAGDLDGHNIENRVSDDVEVRADGELLQLALRQLFDNAVKYSSPFSTISIEAVENAEVEILVRNSGSFIPEAERLRIFERFYRGAQARQVPGTGMGLAIVDQIARAHGGTVDVTSEADAGTIFRLSLPQGGPAV